MADQRPSASSITLPRNFHFHYTDGEPPKTPERGIAAPAPKLPAGGFRVRRRTRSKALPSDLFEPFDPADTPIPTIEGPTLFDTFPPAQDALLQMEGYLSPVPRRALTAPRTPSAQRSFFDRGNTWNTRNRQDLTEFIARPMSACSIMSDSSDESDASSTVCSSYGGSCTSPDSDPGDPFIHSNDARYKGVARSLFKNPDSVGESQAATKPRFRWTPEMDAHLWTTYQLYLQDPTVTPIKTLPGSPPPLGVCHRVAREAKRVWKGSRSRSFRSPEAVVASAQYLSPADGSPDTIKAHRNGGDTPGGPANPARPSWPKLGVTRRRLRELAKRKATIAPHYMRMLQGRSPSPFASSSRPSSQPNPAASPYATEGAEPSLSTRDVQVALTISTSQAMRPDGPLAQLSNPTAQSSAIDDWFNDPVVPWASPPPIPSEAPPSPGVDDFMSDAPRLGSPFEHHHTWGPSRSGPYARPNTARPPQFGNLATTSPRLGSPAQLHGTFPYPVGHNKRRAPRRPENEPGSGAADPRRRVPDDIFAPDADDGQRPVRVRGHTIGDATFLNRLASVYTPPQAGRPGTHSGVGPPATGRSPLGSALPDPARRLGSPFAGISGRPTRLRGRHCASSSLSSYEPSAFSSIDHHLGH